MNRHYRTFGVLCLLLTWALPSMGSNPVDFFTGALYLGGSDCSIKKQVTCLHRFYYSDEPGIGMFGRGWSTEWDLRIEPDVDGCLVLYEPNGNRDRCWTTLRPHGVPLPSFRAEVRRLASAAWEILHPDPEAAGPTEEGLERQTGELAENGPLRIKVLKEAVAKGLLPSPSIGEQVEWRTAGYQVTRQNGIYQVRSLEEWWEFDAQGRLMADGRPDDEGRVTLKWNTKGMLERVERANGSNLTLHYGSTDLVELVRLNGECIWEGRYAPDGFLWSESFRDKTKVFYQADAFGRVEEQRRDGEVTRYSYDSTGHLACIRHSDGDVDWFSSVVGSNTTLVRWEETGQEEIATRTEKLRFTFRASRERGFRCLMSLERIEGEGREAWRYDEDGNELEHTAGEDTITAAFDKAGNRVLLRNADGKVFRFFYGEAPWLITGAQGDDWVASYTYDKLSRLLKVDHSKLGSMEVCYSPRGGVTRVTMGDGRKLDWTYDSGGKVVRFSLSENSKVKLEYSHNGKEGAWGTWHDPQGCFRELPSMIERISEMTEHTDRGVPILIPN